MLPTNTSAISHRHAGIKPNNRHAAEKPNWNARIKYAGTKLVGSCRLRHVGVKPSWKQHYTSLVDNCRLRYAGVKQCRQQQNKARRCSTQWGTPVLNEVANVRPLKLMVLTSRYRRWFQKIVYSILSHNLGRSSGHHR